MGLMDNIKNAQEMAQQAMQQAGGMAMPDAADAEYAALAQKVYTQGVPGIATIKSVSETGKNDGVSKQYALQVSVELEAGDAYDTTVLQSLTAEAAPHYTAGKRYEIKVDPDDKTKGILYAEA